MLKKTFFVVLALSTIIQSIAFADAIQGRVKSAGYSALDVVVYDPQGRPYPNALTLAVDSRTQLNGVRSISDLHPNDPVSADVRQDETGQWRADSVTLFQDINARPATQKPSPTLRDALGNPVVKGALVGAATGAIASSASGGKAGKGALVGAGVGAAAGLLENMFSGGNRQSDNSNNN
jgi:hypothetical protein